ELQASATDDGINLSLGPQHSFPLEDIFEFLRPAQIRETLVQALLASPVFTTRWRWTAARSLALLRFARGGKVPAQLQRMRAEDLLSAVFPAQAACQDNQPGGDIPIPDHPLVFETLRDCLTDALDVDGLRGVLERLQRGEIEFRARDTPMPSVFAHQILNAMPYAFLDDAPLEERRARAVMLRRALPEQEADLGRLDPEAIRQAAEDAWPAVRDAEELHDLLLGLVLFPESEMARLPQDAVRWIESLARGGRTIRVRGPAGAYWAAAERVVPVRGLAVCGFVVPPPTVEDDQVPQAAGESAEDAVAAVIRGWIEVSGPVLSSELATLLGLPPLSVDAALLRLEAEGVLLRGRFRSAQGEEEFCDRRILARIHRATIARLRREIEPVTPADFIRFLIEWQHAAPGTRLEGEAGILEVVGQLQGFEAAAAAWEAEILPARIFDYDPARLDSLCLSGELAWGRWTHRPTQAEVPAQRPGVTRSASLGIGLRESLPWLIDRNSPDEAGMSPAAREILQLLTRRGALFFSEIVSGTRGLAAELEDGLWQLAAAGLVTADSFGALRALVSGGSRRARTRQRRTQYRRRIREGRWSLLQADGFAPEVVGELRSRQLLRRYGVLLRELLARESAAAPWRAMLPVLRSLEARGEIRGGRFVDGFAGEQFALPEAVDSLRAGRRRENAGHYVRVSGCDPLNLVGILTPGARLPAQLGNRVIYRDGVPVAAVDGETMRLLAQIDDSEKPVIARLADPRPASAFDGSEPRS
ncbi:MAG: DEAD/DEAH box helicase, partial [Acidobacteria bacterium]|nr:DEAD/DEAH box helicase [Acidobacteriota bacterium]